ncbi:ankyrin repeat domain-containing protein, partial [bacterium]
VFRREDDSYVKASKALFHPINKNAKAIAHKKRVNFLYSFCCFIPKLFFNLWQKVIALNSIAECKIEALMYRLGCNRNAVLFAVEKGDEPCLRALLDGKADVNERNYDGTTALIEAARKGYVNCISLLSDAKADADARDNEGWTALTYAVRNGNLNCILLLLAAKADVNRRDNNSATVLMLAVAHAPVISVLALLEAKAHVNARDNTNQTALMRAGLRGNLTCVLNLLKAKAGVNARGNNGVTALMFAGVNGNPDCISSLLSAKANVNARDTNGSTVLMCALGNKYPDCVKALVFAKASVNAKNSKGKTVYDLAEQLGNQEELKNLIATAELQEKLRAQKVADEKAKEYEKRRAKKEAEQKIKKDAQKKAKEEAQKKAQTRLKKEAQKKAKEEQKKIEEQRKKDKEKQVNNDLSNLEKEMTDLEIQILTEEKLDDIQELIDAFNVKLKNIARELKSKRFDYIKGKERKEDLFRRKAFLIRQIQEKQKVIEEQKQKEVEDRRKEDLQEQIRKETEKKNRETKVMYQKWRQLIPKYPLANFCSLSSMSYNSCNNILKKINDSQRVDIPNPCFVNTPLFCIGSLVKSSFAQGGMLEDNIREIYKEINSNDSEIEELAIRIEGAKKECEKFKEQIEKLRQRISKGENAIEILKSEIETLMASMTCCLYDTTGKCETISNVKPDDERLVKLENLRSERNSSEQNLKNNVTEEARHTIKLKNIELHIGQLKSEIEKKQKQETQKHTRSLKRIRKYFADQNLRILTQKEEGILNYFVTKAKARNYEILIFDDINSHDLIMFSEKKSKRLYISSQMFEILKQSAYIDDGAYKKFVDEVIQKTDLLLFLQTELLIPCKYGEKTVTLGYLLHNLGKMEGVSTRVNIIGSAAYQYSVRSFDEWEKLNDLDIAVYVSQKKDFQSFMDQNQKSLLPFSDTWTKTFSREKVRGYFGSYPIKGTNKKLKIDVTFTPGSQPPSDNYDAQRISFETLDRDTLSFGGLSGQMLLESAGRGLVIPNMENYQGNIWRASLKTCKGIAREISIRNLVWGLFLHPPTLHHDWKFIRNFNLDTNNRHNLENIFLFLYTYFVYMGGVNDARSLSFNFDKRLTDFIAKHGNKEEIGLIVYDLLYMSCFYLYKLLAKQAFDLDRVISIKEERQKINEYKVPNPSSTIKYIEPGSLKENLTNLLYFIQKRL